MFGKRSHTFFDSRLGKDLHIHCLHYLLVPISTDGRTKQDRNVNNDCGELFEALEPQRKFGNKASDGLVTHQRTAVQIQSQMYAPNVLCSKKLTYKPLRLLKPMFVCQSMLAIAKPLPNKFGSKTTHDPLLEDY
jgi:hypothetical protein